MTEISKTDHCECSESHLEFCGPETNTMSDGYHTFGELYEHRIELFMALCRQIKNQPYDRDGRFYIWRSKLHDDGTEIKGWFLLGVGKKRGEQITYHLPISKWGETNFAETLEKAPDFDGHTSNDVLERISKL